MMLIAQLSAARSNELLFIGDHDFFSPAIKKIYQYASCERTNVGTDKMSISPHRHRHRPSWPRD
jgi:hypothetical protein